LLKFIILVLKFIIGASNSTPTTKTHRKPENLA